MTMGIAPLAGVRLATVEDDVDSAMVAALRAAGAVVGKASSEADIAIGTDIARVPAALKDIVTFKPTVGVVTLFARDLELANRTMAVVAAATPDRHWPSDVRLAAKPDAVVAIPEALPSLDGAVSMLTDTGARVITVDIGAFLATGKLPDEADVLMVPTGTGLDSPIDTCAVAVPAGTVGGAQVGVTVLGRAFDDAVALDVAALVSGAEAPLDVWPLAAADHTELVVFGAHLRGGPLAHQLTDLGARWAGEPTTAPRYRMTVLPTTPAKPAITRVSDEEDGAALRGHRWLLSPAGLGRFLAALPAPMQLGKVEFHDGTWRTAFGCDGAAATGPDISSFGSWPAAIAAGAV